MPNFVEVLPWVAANKDALLALGACLGPVTSIIAAAVSFRAVVTGPKVQMPIAKRQHKLAERQQALHERQFALAEQQLRFAILGASEQKWISDFKDMLANLFGLGARAFVIQTMLDNLSDPPAKEFNELVGVRDDAAALISRIWIHLGNDVRDTPGFVQMLRNWFLPW